MPAQRGNSPSSSSSHHQLQQQPPQQQQHIQQHLQQHQHQQQAYVQIMPSLLQIRPAQPAHAAGQMHGLHATGALIEKVLKKQPHVLVSD